VSVIQNRPRVRAFFGPRERSVGDYGEKPYGSLDNTNL